VFADDDLSDDAFLGGRLRLWQPFRGYRAATDPVFLAAACGAVAGQTVLDLGCGAGAAALCLGVRVPGVLLTGLEVQADYADLARKNAKRIGIGMEMVTGDLSAMPATLRREFDHVIANPPYYPRSGTPSPLPGRDAAMRAEVPLAVWVEAATRRLHPGGWLTLICGADGLPSVLGALAPRMGSPVVLPLVARETQPALRVILRARKGGRAAFRLLWPLVIHQGAVHDGDRDSYTALASGVLRDGQALSDLFNRI